MYILLKYKNLTKVSWLTQPFSFMYFSFFVLYFVYWLHADMCLNPKMDILVFCLIILFFFFLNIHELCLLQLFPGAKKCAKHLSWNIMNYDHGHILPLLLCWTHQIALATSKTLSSLYIHFQFAYFNRFRGVERELMKLLYITTKYRSSINIELSDRT